MPRRVRLLADRLRDAASDEFGRAFERLWADIDRRLMTEADRAHTAAQAPLFEARRVFTTQAGAVQARFRDALVAPLATLRPWRPPLPPAAAPIPTLDAMALVDMDASHEASVLQAIAGRHAARASLGLHLLGQRMAVLACAPAMEAEVMPLGPQRVCEAFAQSLRPLRLEPPMRLLAYRAFDNSAMASYAGFVEMLNGLLDREDVLPGLAYVPLRVRPTAQPVVAEDDGASARPRAPGPGGGPAMAGWGDPTPFAHWQAPVSGGGALPAASGFEAMRHLLAGTRPGMPGNPMHAAGGDAAGQGGPAGHGHGGYGSGYGAGYGGAPGGQGGGGGHGGRGGYGGYGGSHPGGAGGYAGGGAQGPGHGGGHGGAQPHAGWGPSSHGAGPHDGSHGPQGGIAGPAGRQGGGVPLSTGAVLEAIARLRPQESASAPAAPGAALRSVRDALLSQASQATGAPAVLSAEDSDTFELLALLFGQISRELRAGGAGAALMSALEVPLARLALQDRAFFAEDAHPARRLLNTVAEAHAACLEDEPDPQTRAALQDTVEELVADPHGAAGAFDRANERMEAHLAMLARKAELAERRQVEAARGKEKLTLAKQAATGAIEGAAGDQPLPAFVRTLLEETWQDVLTLSWLRHGEDSAHWNSRVATTGEIIALYAPGAPPPAADLEARIAEALELIGQPRAQATGVAGRLVRGAREAEPADSVPITARVAEEPDRPPPAPRDAAEEDCYRRLRSLPYGTWFDFVTNQQGDVVRRRMSWYSVITGNALFVNARGQRVAEFTLDTLARQMARGQARVVTRARARLIDRAWQATVELLRGGPRIAGANA